MKVYRHIEKYKPKIINSIKKFGFLPDHNYYYYLYKQTPYKRCVCFDFGQKKCLITFFNKNNNVWDVINGILAPYEERSGIFLKFLDYIFVKEKAKRVSVESDEGFKSTVFKQLKNSKYNVSMNYALYWPVYDLKAWDEKLSGKHWKKFRNIRNRFYNHSLVKAEDPRKIGKNALRNILYSWIKRRTPRDKAEYAYYLNIINNNFRGFEVARALSIDGEPCSFSAGWKISNNDYFYCGVGIFNYKYKDLGDFVNLDDLMHLKKIGYAHVDLGGSDKAMLHFKKKFRPEKIYKTYIFSVSGKK